MLHENDRNRTPSFPIREYSLDFHQCNSYAIFSIIYFLDDKRLSLLYGRTLEQEI